MENKELKPMNQEEYYAFSAATHSYSQKGLDEKLQEYALLYTMYGEEPIDEPKKSEIRDFIDNIWISIPISERTLLLSSCDAFFAYNKMGYNEKDFSKRSQLEINRIIGKEKFMDDFFGELTKEQISQLFDYAQEEYDKNYTRIHHPELYGKQR